MSQQAVIVAGKRTPIGALNGALSTLPAPRLAAQVLRNLVHESGLKGPDFHHVIMGEVLSAGVGQAPARQALIYADLPTSIPAVTVSKVCGSGLQAIHMAHNLIALGQADTVFAGGMESMSQAPYLLPQARAGVRMGNGQCLDSMIHDGLWDPYKNFHMGNAGELCARTHHFSREAQDAFAKQSFERARDAQKSGHFAKEIVPVTVPGKKGDVLVSEDEGPSKVDLARLPTLKPAFDSTGSITAGNASSINDGAAAVLMMSEDLAKSRGVKHYFRVRGLSGFAHDPEWFTTAPVTALRVLEKNAGVPMKQWDAIEINEAFAVVPMVAVKELGLDATRVNPRGGAIALGHPIGCSGARVVVTLMNHLQATGGRFGAATLCIGGGEALAILLEAV